MIENMIDNKVVKTELCNINELRELQGEIKKLPRKSREKLRRSILENGIIAPLFVWENANGEKRILDGHQRKKVLVELSKEGKFDGTVPVVFIRAETEVEAKKYLLHITSQYGKFEHSEVVRFLEELNFGIEPFELPTGQITIRDFGWYAQTVQPPVYQITGKKPALTSLYDEKKVINLLAKIEGSTITEGEKNFLKAAATRFYEFRFDFIAEYYAHATEEMQRLMEELCLVIIDYNKAIEKGYVKLFESVKARMREEYGSD